jgi:uncharacterized protein
MALFAVVNNDKPDSLALRMATRPAHLAYVGGFSDKLKVGGPLLDAKGEMAGSLMIIEADTLEAAKAFAANDPYAQAGLFAQSQVTAFRMTLQSPL